MISHAQCVSRSSRILSSSPVDTLSAAGVWDMTLPSLPSALEHVPCVSRWSGRNLCPTWLWVTPASLFRRRRREKQGRKMEGFSAYCTERRSCFSAGMMNRPYVLDARNRITCYTKFNLLHTLYTSERCVSCLQLLLLRADLLNSFWFSGKAFFYGNNIK